MKLAPGGRFAAAALFASTPRHLASIDDKNAARQTDLFNPINGFYSIITVNPLTCG
jgi:hypothetical protein